MATGRFHGQRPGVHRGVLAGLTEEERAAAIDEAFVAQAGGPAFFEEILLDVARKNALARKPVCTLAELLGGNAKQTLAVVAEQLASAPGVGEEEARAIAAELRSLDEASATQMLVGTYVESAEKLTEDLMWLDPSELAAVSLLLEKDGTIVFGEEEIRQGAFKGLAAHEPHTVLFDEGSMFTFVLPQELLDAIRQLDWDMVLSGHAQLQHIMHTAEVLADLCGVFTPEELAGRYRQWFPLEAVGMTTDEVWDLAKRCAFLFEASYEPWEHAGREYGIYFVLAEDLNQSQLPPSERDPFAPSADETEDFLAYLLERHAALGPQPLDPVLAEKDSFAWRCELPAAIALRNFLDEHVPNNADDYSFADAAIEAIVEYVQEDAALGDVLNYLEDMGVVLDGASNQEMVNLVMEFNSVLPRWDCNGSSLRFLRG